MRYFLDTEFNGFGGPLISLALVPEDGGAPFYQALRCPDPTPWVAEHVLPALDTVPIPRAEMSRAFAAYLGDDPDPVLVADWPEDIAHAATLLIATRPISPVLATWVPPQGCKSTCSLTSPMRTKRMRPAPRGG